MPSFDLINRRTHLYAALIITPWFFMYAASSAILNHPDRFGQPAPRFEVLLDRSYDAGPLPAAASGPDSAALENAALDLLGARIQREAGVPGSYATQRDADGKLRLRNARFWTRTQITYDPGARRLVVQRARVPWATVLTAMHTRGGFERPGWASLLWSILVDVVQVAILVWIASGLYMWWRLRRRRLWGWLALAAGGATFAVFLLRL